MPQLRCVLLWDIALPVWAQLFTLAVCPPSGIMLFIRKASSGWLKRKKTDWPKHSIQPAHKAKPLLMKLRMKMHQTHAWRSISNDLDSDSGSFRPVLYHCVRGTEGERNVCPCISWASTNHLTLWCQISLLACWVRGKIDKPNAGSEAS